MEYKSLLPAGIHDVALSDVDNHFLSSFPSSKTRKNLISGLTQFTLALSQFGIRYELWIDGSFTTEKLDPNDIDLVVFLSSQEVNSLSGNQQTTLAQLLDRHTAKQNFGCDAFVSFIEDQDHRSYWRGWFGYDRNENPKGIARIAVGL